MPRISHKRAGRRGDMFALAKFTGLKRADDHGRFDVRFTTAATAATGNKRRAKDYGGWTTWADATDERMCLIDDATDGGRWRRDRGPRDEVKHERVVAPDGDPDPNCAMATCVPGTKGCAAYAAPDRMIRPAYAADRITCPVYVTLDQACPAYAAALNRRRGVAAAAAGAATCAECVQVADGGPDRGSCPAYAADEGCPRDASTCAECAVADAECPLYGGGGGGGAMACPRDAATCDYVGGGTTVVRPVPACPWDKDCAVVDLDSGCTKDGYCGASRRSPVVGLIDVLRKFY